MFLLFSALRLETAKEHVQYTVYSMHQKQIHSSFTTTIPIIWQRCFMLSSEISVKYNIRYWRLTEPKLYHHHHHHHHKHF